MAENKDQINALNYIQLVRTKAAEIEGKIIAGDMAGAQARLASLIRLSGDCLEEINAARGKAPTAAGYLGPLKKG